MAPQGGRRGRARGGPALGSTLAFHSLASAQWWHATACRSERHGLFNPPTGRPRNGWLDLAIGGTLLLHALTILSPPLRRLLGASRLSLVDLAVVLAGSGTPLLVNEAIKAWRHAEAQTLAGLSSESLVNKPRASS